MGNKKLEPPSSKNLLDSEFVPTPYGLTCKWMDFRCVKCGHKERITVPQKLIDGVTSELVSGSAFAEHLAISAGWVNQTVNRKDGRQSIYMACPDCVDYEFQHIFNNA